MDPTPASNGGWSVSCGWHSITSLIQPQMNCVIFIKESFLPEDEVDVEEEEEEEKKTDDRYVRHSCTSNNEQQQSFETVVFSTYTTLFELCTHQQIAEIPKNLFLKRRNNFHFIRKLTDDESLFHSSLFSQIEKGNRFSSSFSSSYSSSLFLFVVAH